MYTPINDHSTIDKRISKFIESKSARTPWSALKKTITDWRTTDLNTKDSDNEDISYEKLGWSHQSFDRSGYRKLAH